MSYTMMEQAETAYHPEAHGAPVSITAQINEHVAEICGLPYDYFFRDAPEAMAECRLLCQEYYGLDLVIATRDVYNYEAEALGQDMVFDPRHIPSIDHHNFLINSRSDYDRVAFKGLDSGRFPFLIRHLRAFRKYAGYLPPVSVCAPWTLAGNIYGFDRLIMTALKDPAAIHDLLGRIVHEVTIPLLKSLKRELPEANHFGLSDAACGPPMLTVAMFEEFIRPYYFEITKAFDPEEFKITLDGIWGVGVVKESQREHFADMAISMSGALLAVDPDPLVVTDFPWYRRYADLTGAVLVLGLSNVELENGPPDRLIARVEQCVRTGQDGRTPFVFVLNNVGPQAPPAHVHAVVHTVRTLDQGGEISPAQPAAWLERETFPEFLRARMENNPEGFSFNWLEKSSLTNRR